MIFGQSRVPFDRPAAARRGFNPTLPNTGFVSNQVPFSTMLPEMAVIPGGIRQPLHAQPGVSRPSAPVATVPASAAVPGQVPATAKLPGRVSNAPRAINPALTMALGLMPPFFARGGQKRAITAMQAGRKPTF